MGAIDFTVAAWGQAVDVAGPGGCLCGGCAVAVDGEGNLYVSRVVQGGAIHVAQSTDRGASWNDVPVVAGGVEFYRHASALLVDAAGTVHLFYVDADHAPRHARSFDEGDTWSIQSPAPTLGPCSRQIDAVTDRAAIRLYLLLRDDDMGTLFLVRSPDGGSTWATPVQVATPLPHLGWAVHLRLAIDGRGTLHILAEAIIADQRQTFLTHSRDDGATWDPWDQSWNPGQAVAASLIASGHGHLVIACVNGQTLTALLSNNGGKTWQSRTILAAPFVFDLWSPPGLLKDPNGNLHLFVYLGELHTIRHIHSRDNGNTWSQGEDIFTATLWKTPADIQPLWANGRIAVVASLGISATVGKVRFISGDTLVIHHAPRLNRIEPDHIAAGVGNHFYLMDAGETGNGTSIASVLERTGLTPEGPEEIITVLEVWPDCSMNTEVTLQMGTQMTLDEAVTWHPPVVLNPFTADHAPVRVTGRYIAIRFIIDLDCAWAMHGYTLVYEKCGRH
ncbi:MAG: exo-alpha-sialidase [Magnetococcales bacterium]|nr:exo-alpha-sialidase [Magnetococcales bacterium]